MYELVVSNGIVLGKRPVGEANVLLSVLTPSYGLLRVMAKSSRLEESKLRYGLEVFTQGRFSFVRGRYEWKLVGVENVSRTLVSPLYKNRTTAGRVTKLLLRLIQGEEAAPVLYPDFIYGLTSLVHAHTTAEVESIECVLVLRILFHLGYLAHTPEVAPFIKGDFLSAELSSMVVRSRALLFQTINTSLKATGL